MLSKTIVYSKLDLGEIRVFVSQQEHDNESTMGICDKILDQMFFPIRSGPIKSLILIHILFFRG